MNFKLAKTHYHQAPKCNKDADLLPEVRELYAKFKEYDLDQPQPFTFKLFKDYIAFRERGIKIKGQRGKIVEAIIKYDDNSLFFTELQRTKLQRNREWIRVALVGKKITDLLHSEKGLVGFKRKEKSVLTLFLKFMIDVRRKLMENPLSYEQWVRVWVVERILGIHYEDLTPEENGEIWRLEALRTIKENEENGRKAKKGK